MVLLRCPAGLVLLRLAAVLLALGSSDPWLDAADAPKAGKSPNPGFRPRSSAPLPRAPVLSPQEQLRTFQLPPGFRIELVAAEPLVHDPVAAAYDLEGNLWVVEFSTFNADMTRDLPDLTKGVGPGAMPRGKIVRLESSRRDGTYDRRIVWLDGLEMARGIAIVRDGVLVSDSPNLWLARDPQGTGRATEKIQLASNYAASAYSEALSALEIPWSDGAENQSWAFRPRDPAQARRYINQEHGGSLLWGRDNVIRNIDFAQDYRYRERAVKPMIVPVRGQFGLTQDDFGRLYYNRNSDQLRADLFAPTYGVRHPHVTDAPWANVRVAEDQRVWPAQPNWAVTGGYRKAAPGLANGGLDESGRLINFTAACSPLIYRGTNFPAAFYGNAFVPDPAANLIKRNLITEQGGQVTAVNAYPGREFLTSTDPRFRPVALLNAPDGSMLVVDLHRGVLQEYHNITPYLRETTLRMGLDQPVHGLGRIFRIVHEGGPRDRSQPDLKQRSAVELARYLEKGNAWWRDTAQQELVERGDKSAVPALSELVRHGRSEATKVAALWTLDGLEATTLSLLADTLRDPSPKVRAAAVRVHERWLASPAGDAAVRQLAAVLRDAEPEVTVQLALTLGETDQPAALELLERALLEAGGHPFMPAAIASSLYRRESAFLARLAPRLRSVGARRDVESLLTLLASAIVRQGEQTLDLIGQLADRGDWPAWARLAALRGFEPLLRPEVRRVVGPLRIVRAEALAPLAESADADVRALAVRISAGLVREAEASRRRAAEARPLAAADRQRYERGREVFAACAACHQASGTGLPSVAPSLADSYWVTGYPEILARIVLHGKEGTPGFPGPMPPVALTYSDEQVADVLTYIRNSWGLHAGAVSPELVASVRRELGPRQAPWTNAELQFVERERRRLPGGAK
ncbi:MAG: c-type cytochrome [Opitutaceae bacterium]|nr:c-type cytochrome [Opitutaceae bacterium]